jgi:hypothetical protein
VNYGYGLRVLREHINDPNLNASRYNNHITSVMKATLRTIDAAVTDKIRKIGSNEDKILRSPLINCATWLPPDEYNTFLQFVKAAYGFGLKAISSAAANKLYRTIMKQLKQREMQMSLYNDVNNNKKLKGKKGRPKKIKPESE